MGIRNAAMGLAILLTLPLAGPAGGQGSPDPLSRLHGGHGQWGVDHTAVVPASYTAPLGSPPANSLPPPASVLVTQADGFPAVGTAFATDAAPVALHQDEAICLCEPIYCSSSWLVALELIAARSFITDNLFGGWVDDPSMNFRFHFGYEAGGGLGVRGRFGFFGQSVQVDGPWLDEIQILATTFSLDIFKRLFVGDTEVVLGAGPASSVLAFHLAYDNTHGTWETQSRFIGSGITTYGEAWYPFWRFQRSDLGITGRGRISLLEGNWRDDTGGELVPRTDSDTMHILELALGIEYRRRFGERQDRYWYITWLTEYQSWDSPWMTRSAATAVTFAGSNISFGLAW